MGNTAILDDTDMDKTYQQLGGHDTDSQKLNKTEEELIEKIDEALNSVE